MLFSIFVFVILYYPENNFLYIYININYLIQISDMSRKTHPLHILVACEASGTLTRELRKLGHLAWSCDIQETYGCMPQFHIKNDVLRHVHEAPDGEKWDMMIGFPPSKYLSIVQARWLTHPEDKHLPFHERRCHPNHPGRRMKQLAAIAFFRALLECDIPKIALQNAGRSYLSSRLRRPDFTYHPYMHGEPVQKLTGIWSKNMPTLEQGDWVRPGKRKNIKKNRKTSSMVARAMARQWAGKASAA